MERRGQISRRGLLKAALVATAGVSGLVACGSQGTTGTTTEATTAALPTTAAAEPTTAAEATVATGTDAGATAMAEPTTAAASGGGEQASLTFVCDTINEAHTKLRDEWVAQFMEANPNITVSHQVVPQDYPIRIQTLYAAGTPPDIYRYLQENTPIVTVVEKNLHLKLDELVANDGYDLADFRPDAVELYRWDGGLYALPRDYGNQNLFYNINLLNEAGVPLPTADWTDTSFTFDALREAAQKLTKKTGDRTTQWGFLINRGWRPWASWIYNNGATVVKRDDSGLATEISLTEPNAVEALQFLQDLMYKDEISPKPDIETETGGFELFASGRVAMMINNPSSISQYRTIESFEWDVATLPIGKAERRGTGGGGTGWASASGTKAPEASWAFLKYITSKDAELAEVAIGATTPARTSVVTSTEFLDPSKPPKNVKGFADAQEYVVRDPVNARWPEVLQRVVTTNMDQLWSGALTGEQVAQAIKSAGDPLLRG